MKRILLLLLLLTSVSFLPAQDNNDSKAATPDNSQAGKGQKTIRGCVSRFNGDFILVKQHPAMTYELQSAGKVKLAPYLGQEVEVTGRTWASLSTSSDALNRGGAPSSITLVATSIKTITKDCTERLVPDN